MTERVWLRWAGKHGKHDVYERMTDWRLLTVCDTCKVVIQVDPVIDYNTDTLLTPR